MSKKQTEVLKFPQGFLWGTAIAAHQNEGENINSNWWHWEQTHKNFPKSGKACDHFNRFEEDFKLAKSVLHNNAIRLSIEWARIEPEEGVWNREAVEHYKKVFTFLKKNEMTIFATLFHFTLPLWFAKKGGFQNRKNYIFFERFCLFVIAEYGKLVDNWVIMNEPDTYTRGSYLLGLWPPGGKSIFLSLRVLKNLAWVHKSVYTKIKQKHPSFQLGMVIVFYDLHLHSKFFLSRLILSTLSWIFNKAYISFVGNSFDFIGLNYYRKHEISLFKDLFQHITAKKIKETLTKFNNVLKYTPYPQGIYNVLLETRKYRKPVYVTENGLSDPTDSIRPQFIIDHLEWVHEAIKEGVDVRGYFHWTLMDNFEWAFGFEPKFGLFETDFKTQKRTPRKSAYVYGEICKNNEINLR